MKINKKLQKEIRKETWKDPNLLKEDGIQFTMTFYDKDRETVERLYMDEVEAYMRIMERTAENKQ